MTRYQFFQLGALTLVGIAVSQLLSTFAALFNWQVGLALFMPTSMGIIGWTCFEAAKFLKIQEGGFRSEEPQETNLPFAIFILVLYVIGGLMGVLWTD